MKIEKVKEILNKKYKLYPKGGLRIESIIEDSIRLSNIIDSKICGLCGEDISIAGFNKDKRKKDRLRNNCRDCQNKAVRIWKEKNKDLVNEKSIEYRKNNLEKVKAYEKKSRAKKAKKKKEYLKVEQTITFKRG